MTVRKKILEFTIHIPFAMMHRLPVVLAPLQFQLAQMIDSYVDLYEIDFAMRFPTGQE